MSDSLTNRLRHLDLKENAEQEHSLTNSSGATDSDSHSNSGSDSDSETDHEDDTIRLVPAPTHASSVKIMHGTFPDFKDSIQEDGLIRAQYFDFRSWDRAYDGPVLVGGSLPVVWTEVFRGNKTISPFPSTIKIGSRPREFRQGIYPHYKVNLDALDLDFSEWTLFRLTEYASGDQITLTNQTRYNIKNNEATLLLIRRNNNNCATLRSNHHQELDIDQENGYLWRNGNSWVLNNRWFWDSGRRTTGFLKLAIAGHISVEDPDL
ncbi:hypothetical protein HDU83_008499, partial [Entophlyctis luteolus]